MQPDKLQTLKDMLTLLNKQTISPEQLAQFLKAVVETIKTTKASITEENSRGFKDALKKIERAVETFEQDQARLKTAFADGLDEKLDREVSKLTKQTQETLKKAIQALEKVQSIEVKDGYTPVKGVDYFDGADGHIKDLAPQEVRDSLELLMGDERLDKKAIKGLEEAEKKLSKEVIDRAVSILDQRTQFLINKTVKVDGVTITGQGTDSSPLVATASGGDSLPDQTGNNGKFLTTDGSDASWGTPAGSGDVTAASSFGTDDVLIKSDGTGKGVQASQLVIDDSFAGSTSIIGPGSVDIANSQSFNDFLTLSSGQVDLESSGILSLIGPLSIDFKPSTDGVFNFYKQGNVIKTTLGFNNASTDRVINFPDAAGTVALTSDLSNKVVGPASATDNAIARFDSTTGKLVQNSGVTIDDSNIITVPSADSSNGTARINLSTYERAVSPDHYAEVLRLDWKNREAKPTIAWRDENGLSQAWVMAHEYLQITDIDKVKTFATSGVNTSTYVITISSHGFSTEDAAWFYSAGTLPNGLVRYKRYFVRALTTDTLAVYRTAADAAADTGRIAFTSAGSGTHTIDSNNMHHHVGIEVKNKTDDTLNTRLEVVYGEDDAPVRVVGGSPFIVAGAKSYIVSENATNKDLIFGLDESDVYKRWAIRTNSTTESGTNAGSNFQIVRYSDTGTAIDSPLSITRSNGLITAAGSITANGTTILLDSSGTATVAVDRGASTDFASNVFRTAGTDQWTLGLRNDSTNNVYLRDNINGVNVLQAAQGATPAVTAGGVWTFSNDATVPDEAYGAGWDSSLEVPTKNAIYDKIESISAGTLPDDDYGDVAVSSSGTVFTVESVGGLTFTTADAGADAIFGWDDTAGAYENLTAAEVRAVINVEDGADVTDTANVTSAGALMDSELADITAIKTLQAPDNTTISAFGASIIDDADEATFKATVNLEIGVDVQAYDADLTTWAGLTPSANAQSLVTAANYAAMRTLLDLEAGTDFYSIAATDSAIDADVATHAALTATHGVSGAIVGTTDTQTLSSKTLTAPIINAATLTGNLNFAAVPATDHTANGITISAFNLGATITIMDLVYLGSSSKWLLADADAASTAGTVLLGICLDGGVDTDTTTVVTQGLVRDDTWNWTPGAVLYVSTTPGAITATAPTGTDDVVRVVGHAVTADVIYFNPSPSHITHV